MATAIEYILPCCHDKTLQDELDDIANRPHEVFARDLIFCLSDEHKKAFCKGGCLRTYEILPTSPMNENLQTFVRTKACTRDNSYFDYIIRSYTRPGSDESGEVIPLTSLEIVEKLVSKMDEEFGELTSKKFLIVITSKRILWTLVSMTKLTLAFRRSYNLRGRWVKGTPDIIPILYKKIAETVRFLNEKFIREPRSTMETTEGDIYELFKKYSINKWAMIEN